MEAKLLLCFLLLQLADSLRGINGPAVIKVVVEENSDAVLNCSLSTTSIKKALFDWKKDEKDGQKEVFMYDAGTLYIGANSAQDKQFRGRVSHFPEQLELGNASIIIRKTQVTDSGNYTCLFPRLQPIRRSIVALVVGYILKDRTAENIPGASPKPFISIGNATEDGGVWLKCEVQGAFPKPTLQWQDSDGTVLKADETQVTPRGQRYDATCQTIVKRTETNRFICAAKQEEIHHRIQTEITVPDKMFEKCKVESNSGDIASGIGLVFLGCIIVFIIGCSVGVGGTVLYFRRKKESPANGHAVWASTGDSNADQRVSINNNGNKNPANGYVPASSKDPDTSMGIETI